jgi:hypothetical protein
MVSLFPLNIFTQGLNELLKLYGGEWSATCPGSFIHKNVQEETFNP